MLTEQPPTISATALMASCFTGGHFLPPVRKKFSETVLEVELVDVMIEPNRGETDRVHYLHDQRPQQDLAAETDHAARHVGRGTLLVRRPSGGARSFRNRDNAAGLVYAHQFVDATPAHQAGSLNRNDFSDLITFGEVSGEVASPLVVDLVRSALCPAPDVSTRVTGFRVAGKASSALRNLDCLALIVNRREGETMRAVTAHAFTDQFARASISTRQRV